MSETLVPEVLPPKRVMNPRSLANLIPAKPGDVRNPTGTNRLTRQRKAAQEEIERRLYRAAGMLATALIDLGVGRVNPRYDCQPNLAAIEAGLRRIGSLPALPAIEQSALPNGGVRVTLSWEGPADAAPVMGGGDDVDATFGQEG